MHRLDSYIQDIEPRITAVCDNAPKQEDASLQSSLAAYGWILLDSWIAWRTLRFLIRDVYIEETTDDKWFQTPSSYNASQLRGAWHLEQNAVNYIENRIGKSFKTIINDTIQLKRNSSAHFTKKQAVTGQDVQTIKTLFTLLSDVFLYYEVKSFIKEICYRLERQGYQDFCVIYQSGVITSIEEMNEMLEEHIRSSYFELKCKDFNNDQYFLMFSQIGCKAKTKKEGIESKYQDVINSEGMNYYFFGNKGYYQNIDLFLDTLERCWSVSEQ